MFLLQALGSNGSGQLGLGHQDDVSTPQPVTLPSSLTTAGIKPTQIAAGGNHTLLLLSSGTLLSAGDTASGACGRLLPPSSSPTTVSPSFHPVDLPSPLFLTDGDGGGGGDTKITHIAATWEASVLVVTTTTSSTTGSNTSSTTSNTTTTSINPPTKTSKVYTFGTGSKGELGLGPGTPHTSTPTAIPNFPPAGTHVVDLAACMGHAVAVLSNGEAWGWGSGRKGQLGTLPAPAGATGGVVWAPRRIEGVGFAVARAVCGREFTCLFGGRETGEMVVLGSDKWGVRTRAPAAGVLAGWREG
ncbi:44071e88-e164-448e-9f3c-0546426d4262 [Thermothielavioides terrestris]|uniref:44071e88-e164-448e-9f3c-0546426d4262 n=1 Tax=Thermothielavioides terrestris TaxID=2587410 RepID=A0A3S4AP78_9PEZI|nr:44071e88-e164-448e-9f3c-0546426d4262 [Thermothielavioides terrestris]